MFHVILHLYHGKDLNCQFWDDISLYSFHEKPDAPGRILSMLAAGKMEIVLSLSQQNLYKSKSKV